MSDKIPTLPIDLQRALFDPGSVFASPRDVGVFVHGGWPRRRAMLFNALSAATFPIGAVIAYLPSQRFDVAGLALFGAGNFIYIAASDLIPEIKTETNLRAGVLLFGCFAPGLASMYALAYGFQ